MFLSLPAIAGDWPQILGPNRNGHATTEQLAHDWSTKPAKLWDFHVGDGYAGPAVVGRHVFVFHRQAKTEVLDCLDAATGKQTWSESWPSAGAGGIDLDRGPRCVPLVREDRVYLFGAAGDLHCVSLEGKKIWSRKLGREYKAQDGYFGFGNSPIVIGNTLMVNVGGKGGASIVAVDIDSGATRWAKFDDQASYAAPTTWNAENTTNAIFVTRLNLVGIRPADGQILFRTPFGARGPTVNAATPLMVSDDQVFVTASYRIGAKLISLKDLTQPKVIWESDEALSSQFPTPVYRDGHLYGVHGREDGPTAALRCVDARNGKVKWEKKGIGMAHLIAADEKLLMLTGDGALVLIEIASDRYNELGRVTVSSSTTRAMPALSNGRVYFRDSDKLAAWSVPERD